jgi:hypothetical protein
MTPEVTRYEIDTELYKAAPRGAYTRLAEFRGIKVNNVSKYYDPHDEEYQSVFSKALLELQIVSRVCPEWARSVLTVFNTFGAKWCGGINRDTQKFNSGMESIVMLAARLQNPETAEVEMMPLALELQRRVNAIVDGLRFEDREDAPEVTGRVERIGAATR